MPMVGLYAYLLERKLVTPLFAKPREGPLPPGFDSSKKCEHHFGAKWNTLEECYQLRDCVQDLIDNKSIQFDNAAAPNIITNPLLPHQEGNVNAIIIVEERVPDFSLPSFPWKVMLRALVQKSHLDLKGVAAAIPLRRKKREGKRLTKVQPNPSGVTESSFEGMVSMVLATNQISLTDVELPPEGRKYTLPMHIMVNCEDMIVSRVLIDNGSALNVCPISTIERLNMDSSFLHPTTIIIRAFDGTLREVQGHWNASLVKLQDNKEGFSLGYDPFDEELFQASRGKKRKCTSQGMSIPHIKVTFPALAEVIRSELAQESCEQESDLACLIHLCPEEFLVNTIIYPENDLTSTIRPCVLGKTVGHWTIEPCFVAAPAKNYFNSQTSTLSCNHKEDIDDVNETIKLDHDVEGLEEIPKFPRDILEPLKREMRGPSPT
ncbi:hypothetical protein SO802_006020 [Lithocarpus litseifolius]|uniref:Uncharacterized protein n=1 Tax=Lithocarpus litseifolius TaxID=425828 RepID=A0AAW2DJQ7_9ROSI